MKLFRRGRVLRAGEMRRGEEMFQALLADRGQAHAAGFTLPHHFLRIAALFGERPALLEKRGGAWSAMSYAQFADDARALAAALIRLGMPPAARVALFLRNSTAWAIADVGTMFAGGATVPIYGTLARNTIRHILRDSGAFAVVVDDAEYLQTVQALREDLPELRCVIVRRPEGGAEAPGVFLLDHLLIEGREDDGRCREEVAARLSSLRRDDVASIIYTSGTTGEPKGVMLSHGNFLSNAYGLLSLEEVTEQDAFLSILPLSHAFERTVGYYCAILSGASIAYAEGLKSFATDFGEIRPTLCCVVPALLSQMAERIRARIAKSTPLQRLLARWAHARGVRWHDRRDALLRSREEQRTFHPPGDRPAGRLPPFGGLLHWLGDRLVARKIRAAFGGRLRFFISGGMSLPVDVVRFFGGVGLPICDGYGLTETSPIISVNLRERSKAGTAGRLLPNVEVAFGADGEVLVRGPNVMLGYLGNPAATAEAIDAEGWLHTGDLGRWDEHHYLQITGRKKELIVLATGKNVAPIPIEERLSSYPEIAHAVVIGNGREDIAALIFPQFDALRAMARERDVPEESPSALCARDDIRAHFWRIVGQVNEPFSPYEQVRRFALVPREITGDPDFITPTLKLRRNALEAHFREVIEGLYF